MGERRNEIEAIASCNPIEREKGAGVTYCEA
jgi:hypothetical protein